MNASADRQFENTHGTNSNYKPSIEYILLWLKQAEADAIEAQQSHSPTHSLFWVQQSVEKSIKALMFSKGKRYRAIRNIGHHSLKGYRAFILNILDGPGITSFVDSVLDIRSRKEIGKLDKFIRDNESFSKTRIWGPARISQLLNITSTFQRLRNAKIDELQSYVDSSGSLASYLDALSFLSIDDPDIDPSELRDSLLTAKNLCRHRLTQADEAFSDPVNDYVKNEVEIRFEAAEAGLRLYILSCVTFSHVDSPRYPARPGAPPDLSAAVNSNKRDSFGVQHYSKKIGVICHVQKLAREAEIVSKAFQTALPKVIEEEQLPPCKECNSQPNARGIPGANNP